MVVPEGPDGLKTPEGGSNSRCARIYLARPGRTALNASGVLRGHLDVPLDSVGHHQAFLLAAALGGPKPSAIISSRLRRAVETAGPLAHLTGLVTRLDERLIDRDYGAWAGISANDVIAQWGSLDAAPGVEAAAEVAKRAVAALSDIADEAWGSVAVAVSHDAVNRIALATLDPSLGHPEDVLQETGCFNILECHQGAMGRREWLVLGVNRVPPEVGELFSPTPAPPLLQ